MQTPLQGKRILLGVTGSIACYKAADLASKLAQAGAQVEVILTEAAQKFITPLTFQSVTGRRAFTDADLWGSEGHVQHVSLGHDADLLVIAPASANTLAKLAHGVADNLLTVTALAAGCPLVIAPAMDGHMYNHPATQANLTILKERGALIFGPGEGHLASGLVGFGRMIEPPELLGTIRLALGRGGPLAKRKVVVTAGGTEEPIDPVRSITNRSSGKQGFALAQAALDLGAEVTLIVGLTQLTTPVGVRRVDVHTACEMLEAVMEAIPGTDALLMAAAVADFRPDEIAEQKIKKDSGPRVIRLETNPDILGTVGSLREEKGYPTVLVGFAAETQSLLENARQKLQAKHADLIVANDVSAADSGFSVETNRVTLVDVSGSVEPLPLMSKDEVAGVVLERVTGLLGTREILHICQRVDWEAAQRCGDYRTASLDSEGFIHCSHPRQILDVANHYFHGIPDLVLLWIQPTKLHAELRWDLVGDDLYPHIYGPLNLEAVCAVTELVPEAEGVYQKIPSHQSHSRRLDP